MNIEYLEALVVYLGALILIATPFVYLLEKAAQRWLVHALTTPSPHDDRAASAAVRACAAFLAAVAFLPRVSTGLAEARRIRDAVQAIPRPRVPGALLVLLLVLPMALSTACAAGAHIDQTRTILLETDGYVDRIDARVGPMFDVAHDRAESEARDRAEYDRRMRPWLAVRAAIEGVQVSLLAASTTVTGVEAGQNEDIGGAIACVVESLTQLTAVLPSVGVEVPPLVETCIALLRGISSGFCPGPPAEAPSTAEPAPDPGAAS